MQVVQFAHNIDIANLDPELSVIVKDALDALSVVPTPFWLGKSEKQQSKCILQPVVNAYIERELTARGWGGELRVTGADDSVLGMRIDFHRWINGQLVAMEVQLGNVGRVYGDFFKFLHLKSQGRLALAISVSFTDATARLTDSGLSTHENTVTRITEVKDTVLRAIPVPIVCFGIDHRGSTMIDFSASRFPTPKVLSGPDAKSNIQYSVDRLRAGVAIEDVGPPDVHSAALRSQDIPEQADFFGVPTLVAPR
jgi:hypothetical protein